MSRLFWLNDEQWSKIEPLLPHYGSPPRVDDRHILSGIIHLLRCGCRWCDCPSEYGPYTTVYNRFNRWSRKGIWQNIYAALTGAHPATRYALRRSVVSGAVGDVHENAIPGAADEMMHGMADGFSLDPNRQCRSSPLRKQGRGPMSVPTCGGRQAEGSGPSGRARRPFQILRGGGEVFFNQVYRQRMSIAADCPADKAVIRLHCLFCVESSIVVASEN